LSGCALEGFKGEVQMQTFNWRHHMACGEER